MWGFAILRGSLSQGKMWASLFGPHHLNPSVQMDCLSREDEYGSSCLSAFYSHTFAWLSFCRFTSSFIGHLTFLIIRILVLIISSQLKCSYSFQTCLLTLDTLIHNSFYLFTGLFLSTWHKPKHLGRRTPLTWRIASFTLACRQICAAGWGHFLD